GFAWKTAALPHGAIACECSQSTYLNFRRRVLFSPRVVGKGAYMSQREIVLPPSPLAREEVEKKVGFPDLLTSSVEREVQREPGSERTGALLGPVKVVHAFWLAGMSCDGCSVAVTGATAPSVEDLLTARIPGVPRLVLHHSVVSTESGASFIRNYELAAE